MPNPVSILVWRNAETDPPKGDMERYVLFVDYECFVEMVTASDVVGACDLDARWAELPVVSDLTDKDMQRVRHCANKGLDTWGDIEAYDRFCAALGGGKEEGDA